MTDDPMTAPTEEGPVAEVPTDPPYLAMIPVAEEVRAIGQSIVDAIYAALQGAMVEVDSAEATICAAIKEALLVAEGDVTYAADVVANRVMSDITRVMAQLQWAPLAPIDEREIAAAAAALPMPGGGLPPLPPEPVIWTPQPVPQLGYATGEGVPYPVPGPVPTPPWVREATAGYTPLPAAPAAPYVPYGTAPVPVGNSVPPSVYPSGGTARAPASGLPTGGAPAPPVAARPVPDLHDVFAPDEPRTQYVGLTPQTVSSGPATTRPTTSTPAAPGAATPQTAVETAAGQGGGAPCPPVVVNVHCAPGTTATTDREVYSTVSTTERALVLTDGPDEPGGELADVPLPAGKDTTPLTPAERRQQEQRDKLQDDAKRWKAAVGIEYGAKVASALKDAGTLAGCETTEQLNAGATGAIEAFNQWLYGSKDGKSFGKGGLLTEFFAGLPGDLAVERFVVGFLSTLTQGVQQLLVSAAQLGGCNEPAYAVVQGARVLLGVIEKWVGASFPEAQTKLDYVAGSLCAARIPSTNDAHAAYLADLIDKDAWVCWVRSNGDREDVAEIARDALRTIPSPLQITNVWQRTSSDPALLKKMLRESGVIEQRHVEYFRRLGEYVPAPGDIVGFMVRDVFDQAVVDKYGYDDDLEQKFTGKALEWARSQGMTIDQFRYYWRSHWRLPSPTQGYEMVHRLRPGRVKEELVTTRETVEELLQVNDYPTFWRDRLIELSYRPLTRVDLRRAYFIGSIDEQATYEGILDLGYGERDAKLLLTYWQEERVNWALNQPWAKAYVRGELSDRELIERLGRLKLTGLQQDRLEQELDLRSEALARKSRIKFIRQRVLSALLSWEGARDELVALGYRVSRATAMAQSWQAERDSKGKHLTASELCGLFAAGIVDGSEYTQGLLSLGYTLDDVKKLIGLCAVKKKVDAAPFGAAPPGAEEELAAIQRAAKIKLTRQQQMDAARATRAARNLGLAEEKVIKKLVSTGNTLARTYGGTGKQYLPQLEKWHRSLTDVQCYTRQGAADLIHSIVGGLAKEKADQWQQLAEEYFDRLPTRPCPPPDTVPAQGGEPLAEMETP